MKKLKVLPLPFHKLPILEQSFLAWAQNHGKKVYELIDFDGKILLPKDFNDWEPCTVYWTEPCDNAFEYDAKYDETFPTTYSE